MPGLKDMEEGDAEKDYCIMWSHNEKYDKEPERGWKKKHTLRSYVSITVSDALGHVHARKQLELIADHVSHFAWCTERCPFQLSCLSLSPGQTAVGHWRASACAADEGACWSDS